jgi:Ca2+-binding RTX toxin-like protein
MLDGSTTDDILIGGEGDDTLIGNGGNDTFVYKYEKVNGRTMDDGRQVMAIPHMTLWVR